MVYSYPPFPSFAGGIGGFIIGLLQWAVEIPLIALANMFTGITGAATAAGEQDTTSVIGFIGQTWQNSINSFKAFGVLAPIIASAIWGIALLVLVFFIFKIIQLGEHEVEES